MAHLTRWRSQLKRDLLVHSTLSEALNPQAIESACRSAGHAWRESFWNPPVTLITFLFQVLSAEKTLRAGVSDLLSQLAAIGREDLPSPDPTGYCQARKRLPGSVLVELLGFVAGRIAERPGPEACWLSRRVWIGDGTTVSMPDEPELQKCFPQPSAQRTVEGEEISGLASCHS